MEANSAVKLNPRLSMTSHDSLRVGILSDTHGVVNSNVTSVLNTCDIIVHAGDLCNPDILPSLRPKMDSLFIVRGNNDQEDRWVEDEHSILGQIPSQLLLDLPGGQLAIEHGHQHGFRAPSHSSLREAHKGAKAIVYGHTHKRIFDQSTNPWILNPGAAGETRIHGGAGCAVLTASASEWLVTLHSFEQ